MNLLFAWASFSIVSHWDIDNSNWLEKRCTVDRQMKYNHNCFIDLVFRFSRKTKTNKISFDAKVWLIWNQRTNIRWVVIIHGNFKVSRIRMDIFFSNNKNNIKGTSLFFSWNDYIPVARYHHMAYNASCNTRFFKVEPSYSPDCTMPYQSTPSVRPSSYGTYLNLLQKSETLL